MQPDQTESLPDGGVGASVVAILQYRCASWICPRSMREEAIESKVLKISKVDEAPYSTGPRQYSVCNRSDSGNTIATRSPGP